MRKIIVLFVFICLSINNLYAMIEGCGSTKANADFSPIGKNADGDTSLQNLFKGFKCPAIAGKKPEAVILSSIDLSTGDYQCQYALEQELTDEEKAKMAQEGKIQGLFIEDKNLSLRGRNQSCNHHDWDNVLNSKNNKNFFIPTSEIPNYSGTTDFARYIGSYPVETSNSGLLWGTNIASASVLDFDEIIKDIDYVKTNTNYSPNMLSVQKRAINTNERNKQLNTFSISDYFAGLITLDPDIFDSSKHNGNTINDFGQVMLKGKEVLVKVENNIAWLPIDGDISFDDPISTIINGKFWGFYLSFMENIKLAEHKIVLMLFGFGFFGLVGQKLISSAYSHFGDNEEKHHNLGVSKMIISPVVSLIFFTAPIVPSNLNIPSHFIKEASNLSTGIILNAGGNSATNKSAIDEIGNSTIVQAAIRYFVKWGTLTANELSDYALYPYLNYLELRQGAVFGSIANAFDNKVTDLKFRYKELERKSYFYEAFCKPIYKSTDEVRGIFLSRPLSGKQPSQLPEMTQKSYDSSKVSKSTFGFDTVSARLCAELEYDISKTTQSAMTEFINLGNLAKETKSFVQSVIFGSQISGLTPKEVFNNSETVTNRKIAERMIYMQERTGWIFSALVPISYIATQSTSMAETLESKQKAAEKFAQTPGAKLNNYLSGNVVENKGDDDRSIKQKLAEKLIPNTAYMLLPKFSTLFEGIYKVFEPLKSVIDFFLSITVFIASFLAVPGAGLLASSLITAVAKIALEIFYVIIIYNIAIVFYNYFLQIITLTLVMVMAIYKIAMYFIETLVFFVMSPAVVIWAVVSKKSEVMWHYIGKGAILTITPILIVLSCYLFIFSSETLVSLYSYFSGIISGIFVTGRTSFMTSATIFSVISMGNAIMISANIFIGYITIIKASQWFLETVGAKASVMDSFAGEIGQKAEKYTGAI